MHVFYRISDGSYKKNRLSNATKGCCLKNFVYSFMTERDTLTVLMDGCGDTTKLLVSTVLKEISKTEKWSWTTEEISGGSGAASFRIAMDMAVKLDDSEYVYMVEDDYLHLPHANGVLLEGLSRANYVTLYGHPDKFLPPSMGGNPEVGEDGSTLTRVFKTYSAYWMLVNSTTMTFATKVAILKQDYDIWYKYTEGTYPQDFKAFLELRQKGRSLIQPMPAYSTHTEVEWLSPLIGTSIKSWELV